jgi:hypothetical protein
MAPAYLWSMVGLGRVVERDTHYRRVKRDTGRLSGTSSAVGQGRVGAAISDGGSARETRETGFDRKGSLLHWSKIAR